MRRIAFSLGLALLAPSIAWAEDIAVDPSTLEAALDGLMPGDRVLLAAGTYEHFTLSGIRGTPEMPIAIEGPSDGSARVEADGGPCCNTIQIDGDVSYVEIRNLTIDGRGIDGAFGIDARGEGVHHVTIEACTFVGHDASQQTVAISTKTPTSGWVIRGNRVMGAGTGMYLGNSDGSDPFVEGLIENNLFFDTSGYNVQIKWQSPHGEVVGASGTGTTIIRHNVFIKTDRASPDGDRPNLLVGGFPESGANSGDRYQIYANLFAHNPREALLQVSGRSSIHDNVFLDTPARAIAATDHDLPLRQVWIYNNTFHVEGTAVSVGDAPEGSAVVGNLILAGEAIAGAPDEERDNLEAGLDAASTYVTAPGATLGSIDYFPRADRARGAPIDLSAFEGDLDHALDFNCRDKGDRSFRGAYAGEGENPGWALAVENKPAGDACSTAPPRLDGGVAGADGGGRADGGVDPASSGCGCRASRASPPPLVWLAVLALQARVRSRGRIRPRSDRRARSPRGPRSGS
jgi:hypothetical protein